MIRDDNHDDTNGMLKVLPPKTAKKVVAREKERKARTTLLMALPEDHLAKFHKMADAKEIVFERDVKGTTASSSNTQNVAFVSTDNTSSTNDINDDDMEEMDLKWQVAMISMGIKKFHKRAGRKLQFDTKDPVGFDKTKVECFNCHKIRHFARDCRAKGNQDSRKRDAGYNENKTRDNVRIPVYQDDSKALVTIDGEDIDWSGHVEEDAQNYAMMAYSSRNLGSDNESKLGDASVEITAYTLALKKVEAQLLCHQQNQLAYEQKIRFMKIDLDDKTDVLAYHMKLLAEALKENEDLKTKFENWQNSSKNLSRLLNTQMSANDKFRIGYGDYRYGNYMPSGPDVEIDYSKFAYGPKQTSANESDSKPSEYASCESDYRVETTTSMHKPVENAPKLVYKPKVWTDAPIIEEYESDNDNDLLSNVQEDKEKPSFAFTDSDEHVKTSRENVKETGTPNHSPKAEKHDRNRHTRKGLGYAFTRKTCFICGSFSHLIRDCDFHEKRMAKQAEFIKIKNKVEELKHYNLFSVSQMCDKKNKVLFTDIDCLVLSPDFKLPDENQVLLRIPRKHNMYSFNLKNIDPFGDLACLFVKASIDESNKWVIVTKPQNKTPYELLTGKQQIISYLRPFGCHVTILNTIDQLGKFDGKSNSGFLVGYSLNSKAFRVYNLETKRVEENLHVNFLENKPNVAGKGHAWMFDLDYLTNSINYEPVSVENQANKFAGPKEANNSAGIQANDDQSANSEEINLHEEHFVLPIGKKANNAVEPLRKEATHDIQNANTTSTNLLNTISIAGPSRAFNDGEPLYLDDPSMPHLEDIYASPSEGIFTDSSYDNEGVVTDFNNLETTVNVSPTPTTRIHTVNPKTQILEDPMSSVQTRSKVNKNSEAHALISQALEDKSWFDDMQEELMQFQIQKVWILVDLPFRKKAIRTKWVYRSKKNEKGVVVRNKSVFLYGTIDEEVYVTQPPGFVDPKFPNKVYKVVKALYDLHQAPRAWYATLSTFLKQRRYRRGAIDKPLFIKQDKKDIMLVQVYVDDIIFGSTKKSWYDEFEELMKNRFQMSSMGELTFFLGLQAASTPIETQKPLVKDEEATDVDVYLYRDAYEKKLIQVLKIHTDDNVADLLTKTFGVSRMFKCWSSHHTTNDHQFNMSNPHQELTSPEANDFCKELASPKQTALGKDNSNPFMAGSFPKTKWMPQRTKESDLVSLLEKDKFEAFFVENLKV
nr:hypothetical protein [Tanacetum cinerariifolium]